MNEPHSEKYQLPEIEADSEERFSHPPQVLSIVVLILGALSFLALLKPGLWIFPLLAITLAVISLVSLARNPEKIGRKAAIAGLVLAMFFGAWASSRYFSRQQWLAGHARKNADIFLDYVKQQRLPEAHQLHMRFDRRAPEGMSLDEFYETPDFEEGSYTDFFATPPLNEFSKVAPEATVEYQGLAAYKQYGYEDDVVLRYVARYRDEGKPKELVMLVTARRTVHPTTGECGWAILGVSEPKEDRT
jgi:hypothetical protein